MAVRRDEPYIWVTWITGLLAGEQHCLWSAWYRAHFSDYERRPTDFDLAAWTALHGEMVRARAEALRATGHHVYVEDQNRFVLKGKAATLGGKPDLVAVRDGCALVVDCKSGKRRNKDFFQVLTYMLVLPHVHRACKGLSVAGELQYQDGSLSVEPERLTPQIKTLIRETVERVATETEPARMPSVAECRFCELCEDDCPDRIEDPPPRGESIEHDLF